MSLRAFVKANFDVMNEGERELWLRTYRAIKITQTIALAVVFLVAMGLYHNWATPVPTDNCESRIEKCEMHYKNEMQECELKVEQIKKAVL